MSGPNRTGGSEADEYFTNLETPRLWLRCFRDADLDTFMAYRNDPEVARYQGWVSVSEPAARLFIADMQRARPGQPGEWFQFAIETKGSSELIGDCALHREAKEPRQAEIGYTLARRYHGQGYASEAVGRMVDYAFRQFGLHRVFAVTDARNTASAKLMERLGFRREGHFIQNSWFKGAWSDEYLYAILREEWLRLHPDLKKRG